MSALDRVLDALRQRGDVKQRGGEFLALCPAHDDHNPSLNVKAGDDGRVLLCCRSRGCAAVEITRAIGLTPRDLFEGEQVGGKLRFEQRIDRTYDYRDETGKVVFQTVRLHSPKDFRQRHQTPAGSWEWNLNGSPRVPYRLPELLSADLSRPLFIAEGEKDCDNLARCGHIATTNPMGAGKWLKDFAKWFKGRHVILLPDNDDAGEKHAQQVFDSLNGVAASVKIVRLPDLPPKGDFTDWMTARLAEQGESEDLGAIGGELVQYCDAYVDPTTPRSAAVIILDHFRERYRPVFLRGSFIVCEDGAEVTMGVACSVPDSKLIDRLAAAVDAPTYRGGGVNRNALPGFFKTWSKVSWGDLLAELPDEDTAALGGDAPTGEEFRRLVREALLSEVVFGDVIAHQGVTQTERRSLIDWCFKWAKPGPWRAIRSKRCWCKTKDLGGGEIELQVAIRHELFAQVGADRRLREMGSNTFTRRAERYGVGRRSESDRPHGQRAIVLNAEFVADLIANLNDQMPAVAPEG